jgi:hypothetical protein
MPRGQYNRNKTEQSLIPANAFTSQAWWKKLNNVEQKEVMTETQLLSVAVIANMESRIAIGQHLTRLQEILTPYGVFNRFLRTLHITVRSANRYVAGYKNAKAGLPENVLKVAVARGVNVMGDTEAKPFGAYTEVIKQLPPPTAPTQEQAVAYVDAIENARKQARSTAATEGDVTVTPMEPQEAQKVAYRQFQLVFNKLPQNKNVRKAWLKNHVGHILTLAGESTTTFNPIAVPEDFNVQRGRPKAAAAA